MQSKIIAKNLKLFREKFGYSQKDIAKFLGISNLSMYEKGERNISLDNLEKLSNLFGIELNSFFEEDETNVITNLALAFRKDQLTEENLNEMAQVRKIIKNYQKILRLEKSHG